MTPSLIYRGKVRHRRFDQKPHEFNYRVFMFCFDINAIQQSFEKIKLISIEKFNWFCFKRKNYLDGADTPLNQAVRELVQKKCDFYPKGNIFLLTNLSCLGYCFNPISLYFCFKENTSEVEAIVIEVKNTPWMQKHIYVQNLKDSPHEKNSYTCSFKKELHVSPFMSMDYEYKFNFKINQQHIIVHMESLQGGKKHFDATLSLEGKEIEPTRFLLHHPFMTYKVTAAIYWQAFRLWLKRVPFHAHPTKK